VHLGFGAAKYEGPFDIDLLAEAAFNRSELLTSWTSQVGSPKQSGTGTQVLENYCQN
jgi:hypothetical protein